MHTIDYLALGIIVGQKRDLQATQQAAGERIAWGDRQIQLAAAQIAKLQRENAALQRRVRDLSISLCKAEANAAGARRSACR